MLTTNRMGLPDDALPDRSVEPTGITLLVDRKRVEISWADGHRSSYGFEFLRWGCPCAVCRGEMGRPGVLATTVALTPAQRELVDLQLVGYYGVQPRWADGHDTGIYTFEDLRAACPCAECRVGQQDA